MGCLESGCVCAEWVTVCDEWVTVCDEWLTVCDEWFTVLLTFSSWSAELFTFSCISCSRVCSRVFHGRLHFMVSCISCISLSLVFHGLFEVKSNCL